jgi:hypothetical protein
MYPSPVISALIPDNAFSLVFPHKFFLIMHINICSSKYINVHPNGRHNYTQPAPNPHTTTAKHARKTHIINRRTSKNKRIWELLTA